MMTITHRPDPFADFHITHDEMKALVVRDEVLVMTENGGEARAKFRGYCGERYFFESIRETFAGNFVPYEWSVEAARLKEIRA